MTTWARVEASRHDHTASHHLMQAPTSQLVRKRVEKERIERAFRLQDRDRSGVIEGPELRRPLEELGLRSDDASILAALARHDLDHSGGLDLWEFTTLVREADDAVRQAALNDEETRKRRELRAQRSKATDFFANPEDVTPQANEPSSWAGSQFTNHLTLRGPETYTRAEIHASNERDRIERERRQWIRAKAGVSGAPKSEVKELLRQDYIQPCAAAIRRAKFGARLVAQFADGTQFADGPLPPRRRCTTARATCGRSSRPTCAAGASRRMQNTARRSASRPPSAG